MEKINRSDDEWRKMLSSEQYRILREKGTEPPFTGEYYHTKENGVYLCAACGNELFSSDAKYDSGSGWPSFYKPLDSTHVESETDFRHGLTRTEVHCSRCGSHLGHVFSDGPEPTGLRYCINSVSMKFRSSGGKR